MKVLIACEFSGIVREAFKKRGHDAWSCDLLPTEIPGQHIQDDVLKHLNEGWNLIIAFPPCTHLANSGAAWFERKRKNGLQQQGIDFFIQFTDLKCTKTAIENPVGIMSKIYRVPDQIVHPYYFGDPVPKKTCLWLKGLPPLAWRNADELFGKKTTITPEYVIYNSAKTKSKTSKYSIFGKMGKGHGKERSRTFPGIANAMAEQWG